MKIKKEYIILGLLIIGLSVYLLMRKTDRTLYKLPVLPQVSKSDISKIEVSKNATSFILSKKDNKWYIEPQGYPADENKIDAMLAALADLKLTALISESKDYGRYDLNEEKGIRVKAWQGDTLKRDIDVGKAASSFRHTFVKLAGDDRVFHARDNFRSKFDQTVDDLRDKTILSFKASDIQEILITDHQKSLDFICKQLAAEKTASSEEKAGSASVPAVKTIWQSADGKTADESGLKRLLAFLSNLRCDKFIDDRKKSDFNNPLFSITLKGTQDYSLLIFSKLKEDDSDHPAISSGSDYPFYLSKSTAEGLMKTPADLLKTTETDKIDSKPAVSD
jgi:hypothetical protein